MTESVNFSLDSCEGLLGEREQIEEALSERGYQPTYFSNAGDGMLHLAAQKGDLEAIQLGIAWGLKKEATNKAGNTFLHFAAQKGHLPIIEHFYSQGDFLLGKNHLGQTPYHLALKEGKSGVVAFYHTHTSQRSVETVDHLIAAGYSPDTLSGYGMVTKAIKSNDLEGLKLIASYFKDRENFFRQMDGELLAMAYKKGNPFIFEFLLNQEGIRVNAFDKEGWTPLHRACSNGDVATARRLIELGANLNLVSVSAWYDVYNEYPGLQNTDTNFPHIQGPLKDLYTPLALAQKSGNKELIELLQKNGAKYHFHPKVVKPNLNDYNTWAILHHQMRKPVAPGYKPFMHSCPCIGW